MNMKLPNTVNLVFFSTLGEVIFHFSHTVHSCNGYNGDIMASNSLEGFSWLNYCEGISVDVL